MKKRTITLAEAADYFLWEKRWINRLVKEKGFPREARGTYDLRKVSHWIVLYYRKRIEEAERGGDSMRRSEERKSKYQADMLELKLEVARGEVIRIDTIKPELAKLILSIKQILIGIPKHAARERGPEYEEYLNHFIPRCLNLLANFTDGIDEYRQLSKGIERPGKPVSTPSNANRKPVGRRKKNTKRRGKRGKREVGNIKGGIPAGNDGRAERPADIPNNGNEVSPIGGNPGGD